MGEEIQGQDPGLLKLRKIQGLDPGLLATMNTNSGITLIVKRNWVAQLIQTLVKFFCHFWKMDVNLISCLPYLNKSSPKNNLTIPFKCSHQLLLFSLLPHCIHS